MPAKTVIQLRRDTAANWASTGANPVLAAGELGIETDTNKAKIGDGATVWTALPYFVPETQPTENFVGEQIGMGYLTLNASHKGKLILCSDTGTVTVPSGVFEAGDKIDFFRVNGGSTSFQAGGSLQPLYTTAGGLGTQLSRTGQYATLLFTAPDVAFVLNDNYKQDVVSGVSSVEIGYLDGVTSSIQTQLESKANSSNPQFTISGELAHTANTFTQVYSSGGFSYEFVYEATNAPAGLDVSTGAEVFLTNSTISSSNIDNIILTIMPGSTANGIILQPKNTSDRAAVEFWIINQGGSSYLWMPGSTQPTINQVYSKTVSSDELAYLDNSTANIQTQLDAKANATQTIKEISGDYSLTRADAGSLIFSTSSTPITVYVGYAVFPGERVDFIQGGAGQITIYSDPGDLALYSVDNKIKTAKQYAGATLTRHSGSYYLIGNLG